MPPITWLRTSVAAGAILLTFLAGFELRVLMDHSDERAQLKAQAEAQAKVEAKAAEASRIWETKLLALRAANGKLTKRLQNEIGKAAYAGCTVPVDGVRLYNDALGHGSR